jgi:ParB/RepB/Spo0J family partition protein
LPISGKNILLKRLELDPKHTWVNPVINPRDQDLLRETDPSIAKLRLSMVSESQRDPVLVRSNAGPNGEEYEVIYGSRRRFAALLEDKSRVDGFALIAEIGEITDDADAIRLARSENNDRENLSPWERAMDIQRLCQDVYANCTLDQIAQLEGIGRATVAAYKKLATLPKVAVSLLDNPNALTRQDGLALLKTLQQYGFEQALEQCEKMAGEGKTFTDVKKLRAFFRVIEESKASKWPQVITRKDGSAFAKVNAIRGSKDRYKIDLVGVNIKTIDEIIAVLKSKSKG